MVFFGMRQGAGQDEIADGFPFEACRAFKRHFGAMFQPEINTLLFGIGGYAHDGFLMWFI
ncbi:hypothetical protein HORIV_68960 [Vreelandella olivaria]|uniref:Uncharacterized protein n=1 Tax=Vreelandella olivaria TaxID=390919 RepID=A0ABM7GUQ1_9GAMM|nr:hypothetical protein HORIV_68960 [Halomonas olivaria]